MAFWVNVPAKGTSIDDLLSDGRMSKDIKRLFLGTFDSEFEVDSFKVDSLEGIQRLDGPVEIGISETRKVKHLDLLRSKNLRRSVRSLFVYNGSVENLDHFRKYEAVEQLIIQNMNLRDVDALKNSTLARKIKQLAIVTIGLDCDLSGLSYLNAVEFLNLHSTGIIVHHLSSIHFGRPSMLELFPVPNVKEIRTVVPDSSLKRYPSVKKLRITVSEDKDGDFVEYSNLAQSVENFQFGTHNFADMKKPNIGLIKRMRNWEKVEELRMYDSNEFDISDILDCKFVVDGKLKKISLPNSINWGNRRNGYAVSELKKRGVEVIMSGAFDYEEPEITEPAVVYFICGTSGVGKSTIVRYLKNELGLIELPSFTTRPYRNAAEKKKGTLIQVTDAEFDWMKRNGRLAIVRSRGSIRYALDYDFYRDVVKKGGKYIYDGGHIDPALAFRQGHSNVEIILRTPPIEVSRSGLIKRTDDLRKEYRQLTSSGLDASHIEKNIIDAQARIVVSPDEARRYNSYRAVVGIHVVDDADYDAAMQRVREIVCGKNGT